MSEQYYAVVDQHGNLMPGGGAEHPGEPPEGLVLLEVPPPDDHHLSWDREQRCFVETAHYAVYREDTGELVSVATDVAYPLPEGLSVAGCQKPSQEVAWDPEQRAFAPVGREHWTGPLRPARKPKGGAA